MINEITIDKIPDYGIDVARSICNSGFSCYLVGGAVRDILLGKKMKDVDFTTNALPSEIISIKAFNKTIQVNERFGTVGIVSKDNDGENHVVEVTTFRSEEEYTRGRWPSIVKFGVTLEDDLARRDFTMNALALDMKLLIENNHVKVIDLFDGVEDLNSKIIRAVRDPLERFSEDGLRSVRAIRFASTLQFDIEINTYEAIKNCLDITKMISIERFRDEFDKILLRSVKPSKGIELLRDTGILEIFIPELLEGVGVVQNEFHVDNVYDHNLACLDEAEDEIKLAALFHDIGKPRCNTHDGHFYGHDHVGALMTKEILTRLKYPNEVVSKIYKLIKEHMFYFPETNKWSDGAIRRFIARVGEENIEDLFKLRIADAVCNKKSSWDSSEISRLSKRVSDVLSIDNAFKVTDLNITGHDIMEKGFEGRAVGEVLEYLLDKVLDDPALNHKDKLLLLTDEFKTKSNQKTQ